VGALQFDLVWSSSLDLHVATGSTIGASSKILYTNWLAPQTLRCVIAGLNSAPLLEGEILRLFITASPTASPGAAEIAVTNIVAAALDGAPVPADSFFAAVQISGEPTSQRFLQTAGILNAASLQPGPLAPGEIFTLLGLIPQGNLTLTINGQQAPLLYQDAHQVNAVVPFTLDPSINATVELQSEQGSVTLTVPTALAAPAIFTQNATGVGPGAILNEDYTPNSDTSPAARDSILMIFATGFGPLQWLPVDGQAIPSAVPTVLPVTATIGNLPAEVLYAGSAPTLVAGVMQINVRVPKDLPPNPETPVSLTAGGIPVPLGVTVAIQ